VSLWAEYGEKRCSLADVRWVKNAEGEWEYILKIAPSDVPGTFRAGAIG